MHTHSYLISFIRINSFFTCIVWTHQVWKSNWFVVLSCDKSGVLMVTPLILAITPMTVLQDPLLGPQYCSLFEEGDVDDRLLIMLFLLIEHARGESSFWAPYPSILNPLCLELHYSINWTWTAPVNFRVHKSVWWLQLIFSLIAKELCEYGTGESLRWLFRYLDVLPSKFGTPLSYSEEELLELKGSSLFHATQQQASVPQNSDWLIDFEDLWSIGMIYWWRQGGRLDLV